MGRVMQPQPEYYTPSHLDRGGPGFMAPGRGLGLFQMSQFSDQSGRQGPRSASSFNVLSGGQFRFP
jgi:hypothetical protein